MTTTDTALPPVAPFTPAASGGLPMPYFGKRHDPVVLEPADGLTQDERWLRFEAAVEALSNSTYDFDTVARSRELERQDSLRGRRT